MNCVLIGNGEIGKGVMHAFAPYHNIEVCDVDIKPNGHFDIMLVAIPYNNDFCKVIREYQGMYKPKSTVIFSTVPVGTSSSLGAIHSPVVGKHPTLGESIMLHTRWIGGNDSLVNKFFAEANIERRRILDKPEFTEALKLTSTTLYGLNIEFARYVDSIAKSIKMDYTFFKQWNNDYNALYSKLGIDWAKKYVLDAPDGRLGGHCVVNNSKILYKQFPHELVRQVFKLSDNIKDEDGKLNVLVMNNHLSNLGGSETFTYTNVKELQRRGHNVDVFTFVDGVVSNELNVVPKMKQEYDLILINHNTCLRAVEQVKGYKILTCHGVYPSLEQPEKGADKYVSISEEVKEHLSKLGFESELIYNGIDQERFNAEPTNEELKNVLCMSKGENARDVVRKACSALGLNYKEINQQWSVEEFIKEADLVVSLGRGAYEAMSAGRAVIVYDHRSYMGEGFADGIVTSDNVEDLLKNNFSGRTMKLHYDVPKMKDELMKYKKEMGEFNAKYAKEKFNVRCQIDKYLELYAKR